MAKKRRTRRETQATTKSPMGMSPDDQKAAEENVTILRKFIKAFNARDTKTLGSLVHPEHFDYTYFGRLPVQPEALGRMLTGFWAAYPDWHETVDEVISTSADTVVFRQTGRGSQQGEFLGQPPTGQAVATSLITVLRFAEGKIKEYRSTFPFTTPRDEVIIADEDIQIARAEQGGVRRDPDQIEALKNQLSMGEISSEEYESAVLTLDPAPNRCQALLEHNLRRCQNPVGEGDIYCTVHQASGYGKT